MERDFYYIDAMPGAGKTEYFVTQAIKLMNAPSAKHILLYVAPTIDLLKEAYRRIQVSPDLKNKSSLLKRCFIVASPKRSAPAFKNVEYRALRDRPARAINYLLGLTPTEVYLETPYAAGFAHSLEGEAPPGSLIMTTHESFLRVSRTDHTDRDFRLLQKTHVIFDEARQCVMSTRTLVFNRDHLQQFMQYTRPVTRYSEEGKSKTPWNLFEVTAMEDLPQLKKRFNVTREKDLPKAVQDARQDYAKYVSDGRGTMYMLMNASVGRIHGLDKDDIRIYTILRPATLFNNYGRVTLTSAFFKDSQMYHFLKDEHRFINLDRHPSTKNNPAIVSIRERDRQLREGAARRLVVCPLMEPVISSNSPHPMFTTNLTTTLLTGGMVIPRVLAKKTQGHIYPNLAIKTAIDRLVTGQGKVTDRPELQAELVKFAVPPLWVLLSRAAHIFREWASEQKDLEPNHRALLTINNISPRVTRTWSYTSVRYLKVLRRMLKEGSLVHQGDDLTDSDVDSVEEQNDNDLTPAIWKKRLREFLYCKSPTSTFTIPRSTSLHGLNKYDRKRAFVHLAALNPDKYLIRVYSALLPEYDINLDHSIENLGQTLYRTSLRRPDGVGKVLMIVPYMESAELLAKKIGLKRFQVYDVAKLTPWQHRKVVDEERETTRRQRVSEARRKYPAEMSAKIRKLRVTISKTNARLKLNPSSAVTQATLAKQKRDLEKLIASAQTAMKKGK